MCIWIVTLISVTTLRLAVFKLYRHSIIHFNKGHQTEYACVNLHMLVVGSSGLILLVLRSEYNHVCTHEPVDMIRDLR